MHSMIGVLQALYHRDRTGEGQKVETNIVNGGMTISSDLYLRADGPVERPVLDAEQRGLADHYRLYETADGWVMVACVTAEERRRFAALVDGGSAEELFGGATAAEWVARLDDAGIPAEISRETYCTDLFDDADAVEEGWVVSYQHAEVGKLEQIGTMLNLSETPGRIAGPPPALGQHTVEILTELDYTAEEIDSMRERRVIKVFGSGA
jgi:crotonobetainyl-CoA:carnitine CoA-transferase CaiB-like acyl-CoA transferase